MVPPGAATPKKTKGQHGSVTIPKKRIELMRHWCRWIQQQLAPGLIRSIGRGLLTLLIVLGVEGAALASTPPTTQWSCDGEPLSIDFTSGAVDLRGLPSDVPNTEGNTAPGDGVLIQWRGQTLQLPRTNNAGTPSYTDGRWWWRALDPEHPEWKERRGRIISYTCTALEVEP